MKLHTLSTLAIVASTATTAAVMPRADFPPNQGPPLASANRTDIQLALSNLIGAFTVGMYSNQGDLRDICNDAVYFSTWSKFTSGSDRGVEAYKSFICNAANNGLPTYDQLSRTIASSGATIFTAQLLNSFHPNDQAPGSEHWKFVCQNLDYDFLKAFNVDTRFADPINTACRKAGIPIPYNAAEPHPPYPPNGEEVKNGLINTIDLATRTLFLAASDESRRRKMCAKFGSFVPWLAGTGFDVAYFHKQLCETTAWDQSFEDGQNEIKTLSGTQYGIQLLGTGKSTSWAGILCGKVDEDVMNQVDLKAGKVKESLGC